MKKRNILLAILAIEVLTIPVSAKVIDNILFSVPADAASVTLPGEPGMTQLVVVSNAPFVITSREAIAKMTLSVHVSGEINETRFGDNAQMPGPAKACVVTQNKDKSVIYTSELATALKRGEVLSKSVIVEINYPEDATPVFEVVTKKHGADLLHASACDAPQT